MNDLIASHKQSNKGMQLFAPLLVVSLITLIGLPLLAINNVSFNTIPLIAWMIFFGGVGHVASTAMFYADKQAYTVMHKRPARFYYLPIAVILLVLSIVLLDNRFNTPKIVTSILFFIHLCWLHFHYQKQSYGLIAFAAASRKVRLPKSTLNIVMFPTLSAGLIIIPQLLSMVLQQDTLLTPYYDQLKMIGIAVYIIALIRLFFLISQNTEIFKQPIIASFTALSFLFYLPPILISNVEFAFWSYALAHGFQYLVMLAVASTQSKIPIRLGIAFLIAAAGGAALLSRLNGSDALLLAGVFINWLHFILDAKLWKMSEQEARLYITDRFSFIFK